MYGRICQNPHRMDQVCITNSLVDWTNVNNATFNSSFDFRHYYMNNFSFAFCAAVAAIALESLAWGQPPAAIPVLNLDAGKVAAHVSPTLYGLMTEEINHSYEGGLY